MNKCTEYNKNGLAELVKVLDFVSANEDYHYSKITCGENKTSDLVNTSAAVAFQKVRYFIEMLMHE